MRTSPVYAQSNGTLVSGKASALSWQMPLNIEGARLQPSFLHDALTMSRQPTSWLARAFELFRWETKLGRFK